LYDNFVRRFQCQSRQGDIFKPTIGNESLHEISNGNGIRVVNFATSKNLAVKSTMFPHHNIHKNTWMSPDGKPHNQIDYILVERQRLSNVLNVQSFSAANYDADHYLVVTKVRERLAVNKQRSHRFHMERFNLKKLDEVEDREQCHVEVSNSFTALVDLHAEMEINSAWKMVGENTKISAKESLVILS
jgi:hypothetical protein